MIAAYIFPKQVSKSLECERKIYIYMYISTRKPHAHRSTMSNFEFLTIAANYIIFLLYMYIEMSTTCSEIMQF